MNLLFGYKCPHCYKDVPVIVRLALDVFMTMPYENWQVYLRDKEDITK